MSQALYFPTPLRKNSRCRENDRVTALALVPTRLRSGLCELPPGRPSPHPRSALGVRFEISRKHQHTRPGALGLRPLVWTQDCWGLSSFSRGHLYVTECSVHCSQISTGGDTVHPIRIQGAPGSPSAPPTWPLPRPPQADLLVCVLGSPRAPGDTRTELTAGLAHCASALWLSSPFLSWPLAVPTRACEYCWSAGCPHQALPGQALSFPFANT